MGHHKNNPGMKCHSLGWPYYELLNCHLVIFSPLFGPFWQSVHFDSKCHRGRYVTVDAMSLWIYVTVDTMSLWTLCHSGPKIQWMLCVGQNITRTFCWWTFRQGTLFIYLFKKDACCALSDVVSSKLHIIILICCRDVYFNLNLGR